MIAKISVSVVFVLSALFVVNALSAFDQQLLEDVLDPVKCAEQLQTLKANPSLLFQFFDASGKIPNGISGGNLNDLGDYFQCLAINQDVGQQKIHGKYCMVGVPMGALSVLPLWPAFTGPWNVNDINFPDDVHLKSYVQQIANFTGSVGRGNNNNTLNPRFSIALCIPKVCTVNDTDDIAIPSFIDYNVNFCRLPNDKPFAAADYTAFGIFSVIGLLAVISTCYDLYQRFCIKNASNISRLYSSFSVYTNTQRFFVFKSSPDALECLDGIRTISMLWVVIHHVYILYLWGYIHNRLEAVNMIGELSYVLASAAPLAVDTFFLLSGMLVVYANLGKVTRGKFVKSIHLFYLGRLMRLFPILAAMVLLQASMFNHVSDGPYWQNMAIEVEHCRTYWWSTLLHVQNYVNPSEMCISSSWYLSVDTQLYVLSPLLLFFLFGQKRVAWAMLILFLLIALVSASVFSFLYNLPAALITLGRPLEFDDYFNYYYVNTLTRAPPFVLGMIYGYTLYLNKEKTVKIPWIIVILFWLLSLAALAFCYFIHYVVVQFDHDNTTFDNFLNAYMRSIWAIALGWVIFACVKGYGGPVNWFLSLSMWKLPSRMSYAIYLFHMPLIFAVNGSAIFPLFVSDAFAIQRFMGILLMSFLFGLILCIVIDAPIANVYSLATRGGYKKPPQTSTVAKSTEDDAIVKKS
ncbi:unnamed protein product [Arctia plantaginis]|uniref:Nose resistant-to-fluoxetine protein N-terminal domain-containing protein n=1 Tax=Arctia plantaginis TaxID=874455 RepID=A0A8S1BMP7_ARCPL|nr:unnamed protein product [Arctia plantaginis]